MPWRREQVAPYCYDDVYTPATHKQSAPYAQLSPRTIAEMDESYYRAVNGRAERERREREEWEQQRHAPRWVRPDLRR